MLAEKSSPDRPFAVETPSGKDQEDENFPVASLILARRHRVHVKHFYDFARAADDIADNPRLPPDEKTARLDLFEEVLTGKAGSADIAKARRLRETLLATGVSDRHARDLLAAFRQDARKLRYESWQELLAYCELSANPVGRFLLDLHGQDRSAYVASDALCTALQVLNHLQDCGDDRRELDRVYIPRDWVELHGTSLGVLDGDRLDPGFRRVVDRMLDACDSLIGEAETLPARLRDTRLAINSATIVDLAGRLSRRLRRGDPLAGRVALSASDFIGALAKGTFRGLFRGRPAAEDTVP